MAVGDVYRLIDDQTLLGQDVKNVYYYRSQIGDGTAGLLAAAWLANVLPAVRAIQSVFVSHDLIQTENLNDLSDFSLFALTSNNDGVVTGEVLPAFNSWGFKLNRATRETRNGAKRIAGVAEVNNSNGEAQTAFLATLNDAAIAMGDPIVDALSNQYEPVIVRLDAEGLPAVVNVVVSAEYVRMTTQNTRKPGRGG